MAKYRNPIFQEIEIDMIRRDVHFYHDLMIGLNKQKSAGVLILGITPYLSLFTIETYNYFQKRLPDYAIALSEEFQVIIKKSRMRVKFFDDSSLKVDGTLEDLDWISELKELGVQRG